MGSEKPFWEKQLILIMIIMHRRTTLGGNWRQGEPRSQKTQKNMDNQGNSG
jgi:hypothetical protein